MHLIWPPDSLYPIIAGHPEAFATGLELFNHHAYFEAHEALEALWLLAEDEEKQLLQGLIQLSVALHHQQKGNLKGATSLMTRAFHKLRALPAWLEISPPPGTLQQAKTEAGLLWPQIQFANRT